MADYYAVLKRTLDGLGETKPELRQTLYERARLTIGRQLEASNPPLAEETIAAEKAGLENAIVQIEQEYGGRAEALAQPSVQPSPVLQAAAAPAETTQAPPGGFIHQPAASAAPAQPAPSAYTQPPVAPVAAPVGDPLTVPPAPNSPRAPYQTGSRGGGMGKMLLIGLLVLIIGGASAALWINKDALLAMLEPSVDPNMGVTKVKTVKVETQPEETQTETPDQTSVPTEKFDTRLTENGEEVAAAPVVPSPVTLQPIDEDPAPETTETPVTPIEETQTAAVTPDPVPATGTPTKPVAGAIVAQKAFLYEEGSTSSKNSVDVGAVVWSVVQESPGNGLPEEPAIRARVEIQERNLVLILTIKRNTDEALPASHLIELIFAVPEDFNGGSIENVQRFVFKQSEQERGDALIAVPAKIADGIFLIALNNLDQAIKRNTELMGGREWIDIPLGYRTGRRALITLEKGVPGERVFKEVMAAWAKMATTTAGN